jgi:hypothetical protein
MTQVNADELIRLASEVLAKLSSGDIQVRTARLLVDSEAPEAVALWTDGQVSLGVTEIDSDVRHIGCASQYEVSAYRDGEGAGASPRWNVAVTIHGQWNVSDFDGLTQDHLRAFAIKIGVMTLHPYARAAIHTAVSPTLWPPYTLDMISQPEVLFADEDGLIDLDAVSTLTGVAD